MRVLVPVGGSLRRGRPKPRQGSRIMPSILIQLALRGHGNPVPLLLFAILTLTETITACSPAIFPFTVSRLHSTPERI